MVVLGVTNHLDKAYFNLGLQNEEGVLRGVLGGCMGGVGYCRAVLGGGLTVQNATNLRSILQ